MGELAAKIRAKYPGVYDALPDAELESKVTTKFPGVYDHLTSEYRGDTSGRSVADMQREFIANEGATGTRIKEGAKAAGRAVMPYVRPVLEGGGAVAGGIVGGTSGALASLGLGAIPGGVAGSALGYAGGAKLADLAETAAGANSRPQPSSVTGQLGQSLADLGTGATYEMGGQVAGKVIGSGVQAASKYIGKTPLQDLATSRAKDVFEANKGLTAVESKNAVDAAKLTNKLNVKLTPAQMTGKPSLAAIEQGLATADPEFAAALNAQDTKAKQAALIKIQESIGKGKSLPATQDLATTGQNTVEAVRAEQSAAKKIHEDLYDAIPNTPQPTDKIKAAINDLKKNFRPGDEEVFPSRAIARVEEAIQGPKPSAGGHGKPADPVILDAQGLPMRNSVDPTKSQVGFQDLHSLRKDIGRQIQDASTGMKPNRELAAKLQTIKSAIDDTIEESMGASNEYKAAKDAFIDYAGKYRTGAINKVLARGNEASGLRTADENIARQFFTPSGAMGLIKAVGKTSAKEQMKPFVIADMLKTAAPDGVNYNVQSGINYIQKNRATLEQLGLVQEARTVLKDQLPNELERLLAKRAPDATGAQFFTPQDMRGILQKYGNTIKQLYGQEALQSFRDYNQLMGMIERKNVVTRGAGSNTAEKAMNVANLMIKESVGPVAKMRDGLVGAIAKGAGVGGAATFAGGHLSPGVAASGAAIMAGRQLLKNADNQVAHIFVKILKDATLNPAIASDIMKLQRTGKVPATLQAIIDNHLITGTAIAASGD